MHSLNKPTHAYEEVFETCVNSRQEPLKSKLCAKKDIILYAVTNYDQRMTVLEGHEIQTVINQTLDPDINEELKKLYSDKMVGGLARSIYDKILANSMLKGCCFCSYEDSAELDHFLPKSKFSDFSIAPINLVPVCHRCNKAKREHSPNSNETSFIHPYYETCTEDMLWLQASVIFSNNCPSIIYSIFESVELPLKKRLEFQLSMLNLDKRYSLQAARELTSRKKRWQEAFERGGSAEVKIDLKQEYDSEKVNNRNSWKSALYASLFQDEQFCEMNWNI